MFYESPWSGEILRRKTQMGNFNVKNFFGSMFTPVQDEEIEENYYEDELECLIEDARTFIVLHRIGDDKVKIRIASEICNMLNNNIILRNGNETFKGWCEDGDIFAGDENEKELIALMEQVSQYVDKITYDYLMTY
jgi:hypothetical protein